MHQKSDDTDPTRQITTRLQLLCGTYVIVPYIKDPSESAEFIIRIACEESTNTAKYAVSL